MKLMTFNIRHAKGMDDSVDLKRVIAVIQKVKPDILALQEVDRFQKRSGNVDQVAEIGRVLGMEWCFAATVRIGSREYGNALISRYKLQEQEIILFPGDTERRCLLRATIDTKLGRMVIMTTHLGVTERDRARQFPLLTEQLSRVEGSAVLMGDFNMEADHSLMQQLKQLDWWELPIEDGGGTVVGGSVLDHIYTKNVKSRFFVFTMTTDASDHCPVVAETMSLWYTMSIDGFGI